MIQELLKSSNKPKEISALFKMKFGESSSNQQLPLEIVAKHSSDMEFCYAALDKVSRSFAMVIRQLPYELKDPICIFYLVLRGLDTIEDDMEFPADVKKSMLLSFHEKCYDPNWKMYGVGDTHDYKVLLENFDKVTRSFLSLKQEYQLVIADICKKMGEGMCHFIDNDVNSEKDFDLYCHAVAGLVGHGLAALFSASGIEDKNVGLQKDLANSMGLFLQKTNIIRDFQEDLPVERVFWPSVIWSEYAEQLEYFTNNPESNKSVDCLNHMIENALRHIPDCIEFMSLIQDKDIFRFCAIPQAMAIATLSKLFQNANTFKKVVKIRKGLAARMIMELQSMQELYNIYSEFAESMLSRIDKNTNRGKEINQILEHVIYLCEREKAKFIKYDPVELLQTGA